MNRGRVLILIPGTAVLFLLLGIWAVDAIIYQPREAARQATISAQAAFLATSAHRTAQADAATVAAVLLTLDSEATARATAQAATASAQAATQAASVAAQQTAVAATATANFLARRCQDIRLYTLAVDPEPILFPGRAPSTSSATRPRLYTLPGW